MSSHQLLLGAGASIKDPDYLEEVFKVHTYVGNNTTNNVQTKIDMGGRGAMVILKNTQAARDWNIFDTVRGPNSYLKFNSAAAGTDAANAGMVSFNADGFTLGADSALRYTNVNNERYVSYTFKKRPKFFDIQTYTGNGTAGRQIPHDLEAIPGCVWIKCTSHNADWEVYHKEMSGTSNATHIMQLNTNGAKSTDSSMYNNAAQNSDAHFTLGDHTNVNHNGRTYVMYLFAHNEGAFNEKSQPIIHCGKYTGNGGDEGVSQDLGANQESQFLLVKSMDHASPWVVVDSRRGLVGSTEAGTDGESKVLNTNNADAQYSANCFKPHGRGFQPMSSGGNQNQSGKEFLYISITAETGATMKTPTSGDEVFDMSWTRSGASSTVASWGREGTTDEIKFPVDFAMVKNVDNTDQWYCGSSKLRDDKYFNTNASGGLQNGGYMDMSFMKGFGQQTFNSDALAFMWRRSPCFDVQTYIGGGQWHYHNLGQEPKMMWVKAIHHNSSWRVAIYYPASINAAGTAGGSRLYADIGSNAGMTYDTSVFSHLGMWTSGTDKFLIWTDSSVATSGRTYMAYLFSELSGIAHFSYYIGDNTNTKTITTGFKPRFIMIKDIKDGASGTNWCIFGDDINPPTMWGSGNDNPLALNSTTAKSQNDFVHSFTSTGFSLKNTQSGDFHVNKSNGRYLCWAHA